MQADERLPLFEDFALDEARGCLVRGREVVHLRPQAYPLLRYPAENRGQLVEKESLIQHVWQGRAVGDDSLVQCLRDVRQALGEGGTEYIRTVRGRGYIFETAPNFDMAPGTVTERIDLIRVVVEEHASDSDEGADVLEPRVANAPAGARSARPHHQRARGAVSLLCRTSRRGGTGLDKRLEIEPGYWVAHVGLGRVYVLRGMFPEAIAALRKARELSSNATEPTTIRQRA